MATLASFGKALKSKLESLGGSIYDIQQAGGAINKPLVTPTKIDPIQQAVKDQQVSFTKNVKDTFLGQTPSTLVNSGIDTLASAGESGGKKIGSIIDTSVEKTTGLRPNFERTFGAVGGGVASVPKTIRTAGEQLIGGAADTQGLISAGANTSKIGSKALKTVVDPALSIISATPMPLFIGVATKATGTDKAIGEGINTVKGNVGQTLGYLGLDQETANELGSTLVDGLQVVLSLKGGAKSAQVGSKAKVQGFKDAARQGQIFDKVRASAAARPGATPASINQAVAAARSTISNAKASPVTFGDVAKFNLSRLGYDVAANTAIPVLGIAMQGVRDGDYESIDSALESFAGNAGVTLLTAIPGFKGIKKITPDKAQMTLDDAKSSTLEVVIPKIEEVATVKENKATTAKSEIAETPIVRDVPLEGMDGLIPEGTTKAGEITYKDGKLAYTIQDGKMTVEGVEAGTRRQGIGSELMKKAEEIAADLGLKKIELSAIALSKDITTPEVVQFYKSLGYKKQKGNQLGYQKAIKGKSIQEITTPTIKEETNVTPEGKAKDLDFAPIESGSMYKSDDTVNASVDKVLNQAFGNEGKFSLGLSRFAPATIAKAARNYSTGRFLNNILVRVGDTATQLGNFIDRGQRVMQNSYRDLIAKQAGLTDAKGIEKQDFTFNEKDMIGKVSPEGIPVTKENVKTFRDTYSNIAFWERAIPGMNLDQTRNVVRAAYLYDFYKDSPETLNKYFSQEQQAYLKNLDESVETNIYGTFSPKAQKDGALGETVPLVEGYKHFDILQKNYERIPKKVRESIEIKDQNGTVHRFKNGLELQTFIKNAEKFGIKLDPKAINTLALDKKGPEIDPYRTHGSVARLLSYGDTMGKAYGDTYAVKTLDSLRDNAEGAVKTYIDSAFNGTFGGKGNKNIYEQFLGIADGSSFAKAAQGIQRVGAGAALAFNPATYTQAVGTSAVRNLTDSAKSIAENLAKTVGYGITGQGDKSLKSLALAGSDAARAVVGTARIIVPGLGRFTRGRDQQLVDTLTGEGFVTGYELFDGKGSEIVALSSGLSKENNAKAEIAIRGMQRVLNETGRLSAKDILSGKDLAEAWQKFKDEDPTGYKIASDQIYQDAKMVADVSRLSRLTFAGLYNTTGGFKSYPLGLLSQIGSDIGTMGTYVLSKLKKEGLVSDKQAYGAASRIAAYAASYKIAETAIRNMLGNDETDNEEEKKWKDKLAEVYTHRLVGNPQYTASELVQSLLSNVGIGKAATLLEGVRLASQEYANNEDPERAKAMAMNRMYATMEQLLGGLGGASNIAETVNIARTGEATSFRDIVAGQLGTMSLDNTTGGGLATGEETTSVGEALLNTLGYNKDKRLIDYMYGRLSEEQLKDIPENLRPIAIWGKDTIRAWGRSGFPGAGYAADLLLGSNEYSTPIESRIQAQFAFEAAKNLKDAKFDTLQEYLELNGIPKAWTPLMEQAMADRFSSVAGKYSKGRSAASGNNQIEETINEFFSPRVIDGKNFRERLIDVQTKNPKVFNDILNYIGKVAMIESQREVPVDLRSLAVTKTGKKEPLDPFAKEAWSKIKEIGDSTSQTDNAIYDVFGGDPLKTAFTQSVVNSFKEFTKDMTTKGIGEALGNLDSVERITKFLLQNSESTNNYIDAISLGATELRTGLDDIRKYISANDFQSRYPFLTDALREGLSLRGEDVKINEAGPTASATTGGGGSGRGSGGGASSISSIASSNLPTDLPGVGTKQKESKAIKLQSGKPSLRQIASLLPTETDGPIQPQVQVGLNQQGVRQGTTSLRQFGAMLK